ncbi:MAG: hypothetical protein HY321_14505 [Armatimonadetes bacterium]|nr:hypothetical protein [Armatimonadota bacterium]
MQPEPLRRPAPALDDGLCRPAICVPARQLLGTVCVLGGAPCPLIAAEEARVVLDRVKADPTAAIRLESDADAVPHYTRLGPAPADPEAVFNRKRDLDVLQRLGLAPGDTRRARYLYAALFAAIETPDGICAHDTPGWEGCPHARSGAYERVRARGWQGVVYARSAAERAAYRSRNAEQITDGERLFIRPHHLMCLSCWHNGGQGKGPRSNDTLYEVLQRVRRDPDVPITLVEGCCMACDCCDGFHPENGRCVHDGGLIRDYKKDLDVFQRLGLMPGATLPAREAFALLFERVPSTRDICGFGDGVLRSREWTICGGPDGSAGYARTRETGVF